MNLPEENASTAELKTFADTLGDDRRLRLAAALLAPSVEGVGEADDAGTLDDTHADGVSVFAAGLNEFDVSDSDFDKFSQLTYAEI